MNNIFLVRHGENPANITKEFSHKKVDYSLTEKGKLQSQQTADYFTTLAIDEIYSSPLKRALETAEAIASKINKDVNIIESFREVNVGDLENMEPNAKSWGIYKDIKKEWLAGNIDVEFPGGESKKSLYERFITGLKTVTKNKSNKNIIVVGHGDIFTTGVVYLCKIKDEKEFITKLTHNCSIGKLEVKTSDDTLEAKLIDWGNTKHLSGEAGNFVNPTLEGK